MMLIKQSDLEQRQWQLRVMLSLNEYLLSICYEPPIVLGTGDVLQKGRQTGPCPEGAYSLMHWRGKDMFQYISETESSCTFNIPFSAERMNSTKSSRNHTR